MKLDKIKFATLIGYCANRGMNVDSIDVIAIDDIIDTEQQNPYVSISDVDELLRQLNAPNGFISAIKAYRVLTGAGLKEAKDAIERYRTVSKVAEANLGDILRTVTED